MKTDDLLLLIFWIVSGILTITFGILGIREERENEVPDYTTYILMIVGAFTPGIILIGAFALTFLWLYVAIEGPNYLLKKIIKPKIKHKKKNIFLLTEKVYL